VTTVTDWTVDWPGVLVTYTVDGKGRDLKEIRLAVLEVVLLRASAKLHKLARRKDTWRRGFEAIMVNEN